MKDFCSKNKFNIALPVFVSLNIVYSLSKTLLYANQVNGVGKRFLLTNTSFTEDIFNTPANLVLYIPVTLIAICSGFFMKSTYLSMRREALDLVVAEAEVALDDAEVGPVESKFMISNCIAAHWKSIIGLSALIKLLHNSIYQQFHPHNSITVGASIGISSAISSIVLPSICYCNMSFFQNNYTYSGSARWKAVHAGTRALLDALLYFSSYNEYPMHLGARDFMSRGLSGWEDLAPCLIGCFFLFLATTAFYFDKLGGAYQQPAIFVLVNLLAAVTKGIIESLSLYSFLLVDVHMRDNFYAYEVADKLLVLAYVANISSELSFYLPKGSIYNAAKWMGRKCTLFGETSDLTDPFVSRQQSYAAVDNAV